MNRELQAAPRTVPDVLGGSWTVAVSRDSRGVQSEFVEGVILLRPRNDAELRDFLNRHAGSVVDDDRIPEPPSELGIVLTEAQRKPTEFVVRIDLTRVSLTSLAANARAVGLAGSVEFSSEAGLRTFALALAAKRAGLAVAPDYVARPSQLYPVTMFNTAERAAAPTPPSTTPGPSWDAFTEPRFGTTGSQSNVTLAWQFLAAHGIERRARVAIIDNGFWLDTAGRALGTDTDFVPPPGRPTQYDFSDEDSFAGGFNPNPCSATNPCFWHGTGSAGVATGTINNFSGAAGTGGMIADAVLFRFNGTKGQRNQAVRTAVAWGADVVSMSFGSDCDESCRVYDRDHNPFDDAVNSGSRVVFISAAGNGRTPTSGGGPVGYDVGTPSFFHPCIEDRVICVGSLNDNATTKAGFSNFGGQVQVFAPTNIRVMSQPAANNNNAAGPATTPTFGGTSASTAFVAGVAAMMKAINPSLNHDDVARLLRESAYPGAGSVTRRIDALAAARRAADAIAIVNDRFEINDLETGPTDLGAAPSYRQVFLNLDQNDRDRFRFEAPGGSGMTLSLEYPQGLSPVTVAALNGTGGACGPPALVSATGLSGRGRLLSYRVPGGQLELLLRAEGVNAYNVRIAFSAGIFTPDGFEPNNSVPEARYIHSTQLFGLPSQDYFEIDPRVTIDATVHNASDVDYYIVRGAATTLLEQIHLVAYPAISVYGNDSPITLQVHRLMPDNTQGPLVANLSGPSCVLEPLSVRLDKDVYYLVTVSGAPGAYSLHNGIAGERRQLPVLVRDKVYEVMHPGEPVEQAVRFPERYLFPAQGAQEAVRSSDPRLHLKLFDAGGALMAEGLSERGGERLDLGATLPGQLYVLEVTPRAVDEEPATLSLSWDEAAAVRTSGNLILNPGAEITSVPGRDPVPHWTVGAGLAGIAAYGERDGEPSPTSPGPHDRGNHLFSGLSSRGSAEMHQSVAIDDDWRAAIDAGQVRLRITAFLGGIRAAADRALVHITLADANGRVLGEFALPSITTRERKGETGLVPVSSSDRVPAGTASIRVDVRFQGDEAGHGAGLADNLELVLTEH